jgi:hypothetical protein
MEAASLIATIGFGAKLFMLWFLGSPLRAGDSWSRCRVARARKLRPRREILPVFSIALDRMRLREEGSSHSDDRLELLENQNHEKGEYDSGLAALDACVITGKLRGRSVRAKYNRARWERSL